MIDLDLAELTDFWCPESLVAGTQAVLDGEYDCPTFNPSRVGHPLRILDIGANIGGFTRRALMQYPGCTVTAYEPHNGNATLYRQNCPGVELVEAAVVECGTSRVRLYEGLDTGQSSLVCRGGQRRDVSFEVETYEAKWLPPCDLMKLDCEGCEREILRAYSHLDSVAAIALEWHSWQDQFVLGAFLIERGFRLVGQKVDDIGKKYGRHSGLLKFVRPEFRETCGACHLPTGQRAGFRRADGQFECVECDEVFA